MPGPKKKYNVRFPPGRIKKIMQKDTDVGRIATAVPVIISKALEMFLRSLLSMTCKITQSRKSRVMSINHMKQCIHSERLFDFLKDLADQASTASTSECKTKGKWQSNSMCPYHVTYQRQLRGFTAIHKSFPVASWDSKVSIICTLQNLTGRIRSSGKRWQSVSIKARSPEREEPPQKAPNDLVIDSDSSSESELFICLETHSP